MKIETIEISGFASALVGLRKPYKGKIVSDVKSETDCINKGAHVMVNTRSHCTIFPQDLRLMQRLVKAGDEHAKCIRGIRVTADIRAPRYFWSEHDTYKVGVDNLCSESTMHTLLNGGETTEDDYVEGTPPWAISGFNLRLLAMRKAIETEEMNRPTAIHELKKCLPEGYLQTRTIQYSYQALRRIYFQRKGHMLPEWKSIFTPWIETLPLANELILIE